jgi:Ulp1 family protease
MNLTATDWARLEDGQHLNDALLDLFIGLLVRTLGDARVHAFSSLFFSRLSSQGVQDGTQGWANVETWTRGLRRASALGIFACDFLFLPIHDARAKHWSLAVISRPWAAAGCSGTRTEATVSFLDSCAPNAQAEAQVMHFVRGYLASEWSSTGYGAYDSEDLMRISVDAPQQNNDSDCGVFVLEFVLQLLKNRHMLDSLGRGPVELFVPGLPRKRWRRAGAALRAASADNANDQVHCAALPRSWFDILSEDQRQN